MLLPYAYERVLHNTFSCCLLRGNRVAQSVYWVRHEPENREAVLKFTERLKKKTRLFTRARPDFESPKIALYSAATGCCCAGRKVDHSLPSSALVKNVLIHTFTPAYDYTFIAWQCIKTRDKFNFTSIIYWQLLYIYFRKFPGPTYEMLLIIPGEFSVRLVLATRILSLT